MKLEGIDGTHLFGFLSSLGTLALLDEHSNPKERPRLRFDASGIAELVGDSRDNNGVVADIFRGLQALRPYFEGALAEIKKPTDFTASEYRRLGSDRDGKLQAIVAGLACCVEDEAVESSLCAANGASHQNLVQSIRDVLALVSEDDIRRALFFPWSKNFAVSSDARKALSLGTRKPTLRLDPADERLYALRLTNPTSTDDFKTELGAQALVIPAFALLPVVPSSRPVTVASERERRRVVFYWSLWSAPATLATVRSLLVSGVEPRKDLVHRGVASAFRAARVSGDKGKLSFAPSEGVW